MDILKKDAIVGSKAREAIRYLEQRFKYRSPYLVGQKPEEIHQIPSSISERVDPAFHALLGASLYFQEKSQERANGGAFYLITDDSNLQSAASLASIDNLAMKQFGDFIKPTSSALATIL